MKPAAQPSFCYHYFAIFLIQTFVAFMLFSYHHFSNNQIISKASIVPKCTDLQAPESSKSDLVILLWTWPFGFHFPLDKCPKPFDTARCLITADRNMYNKSNAVVLHHRDVYGSRDQLPQLPRPEGQYWLWFTLESPTHNPNMQIMDNLINLTMTYRSDSDIFATYGWLDKNEAIINYTIPEKSKLVSWLVSNWNPASRRVHFYEELKKYLTIDIYGRQHLPLRQEDTVPIVSKYKFYLAFENSIHRDYITEKLWLNALTSGTVPVVLGPPRENYEWFIPSDAFIHVDDFPSAKELATYLLELDKDDQKYQQYFKWRSKYSPVAQTGWIEHYCKACVVLQNAPPFRTTRSIAKWFT